MAEKTPLQHQESVDDLTKAFEHLKDEVEEENKD